MQKPISTVFGKEEELSSDAEKFYKEYWTPGNEVTERTKAKNGIILSSYFPCGISGKRILEIGVGGEGGVILDLKNNNHVEGIDISDSAILNCRNIGLEIKKANLDKERLPFEDSFFDIVFALEIFEHFSNPQHALEEVKRVLKSGGMFAVSIPTPFTYHWPRLFYPPLFEFKNFHEFLMINDFEAEFKQIKLFQNLQGKANIGDKERMLSWFWECRKIADRDASAYFRAGQYFWEQRNESGLRLKVVEAVEMFRKSFKIDRNNIKTKLQYLKGLLYRHLLGESDEFNELMESLNKDLNMPSFQNNPEYLYELLLFDLETKSMAQPGFDKTFVDTVINILMSLKGGKSFIDMYEREKFSAGVKDSI